MSCRPSTLADDQQPRCPHRPAWAVTCRACPSPVSPGAASFGLPATAWATTDVPKRRPGSQRPVGPVPLWQWSCSIRLLMMIHDIGIPGIGVAPDEADAPLIADANAVLPVRAPKRVPGHANCLKPGAGVVNPQLPRFNVLSHTARPSLWPSFFGNYGRI